jgi:hypothetical protein
VPPLALPVKFTARGACPEAVDPDAEATTGVGAAVTVIVRDLLLVAVLLSVTVRVAV